MYTHLDQLFDEIFDSLAYPEHSFKLLSKVGMENKLNEILPAYPVSNYYIEKDGTNIMEFSVPGLSKKDVSVTVVDSILTIYGEKKDEEKEGRQYISRKLAQRSFKNSFKLPSAADVDNISIELKDGMLRIEIPIKPKEERKPKQLVIN